MHASLSARFLSAPFSSSRLIAPPDSALDEPAARALAHHEDDEDAAEQEEQQRRGEDRVGGDDADLRPRRGRGRR